MRHLFLKSLMAVATLAAANAAFSQTVFRVTTIPEEVATEQTRKFGPIVKYLESKLGQKVEFTPVSDYPAAVEALVNKQVDMVWFGGFTFVQASVRSGGKIVPIAKSAGCAGSSGRQHSSTGGIDLSTGLAIHRQDPERQGHLE